MKKIMAIVLCVTMLLTSASVAFAVENADLYNDISERVIINEYQAVLAMNEMTTSELQVLGYSKEEIASIRDVNNIFDAHIQELATLPTENLENLGYSSSQINKIKTFDTDSATNLQRALMSANCITEVTISNYTGLSATIRTEFEWNGVPTFKFVDVLVTAWNNWSIDGKTAKIEYADVYGYNDIFWEVPTYKMANSGLESYGAGYMFDVPKEQNYYYSRSGYSAFRVSRDAISHLEASGRVGHAQVALVPSFSTSGLSISFNGNVVSLGNGHASTND